MIQSTIPALFAALPKPGEAQVLPTGEGIQSPDFGAFLADQGIAAPSPDAESLPLPIITTAAAAAAAAATSGKILPPVLPEAATATPPVEMPDAPPLPVAAALALHPLKASAKPDRAEKSKPEDAPETAPQSEKAQKPLATELPNGALIAGPAAALPAASTVPPEAAPAPSEKPKAVSQGAAHRTIPTLPASASAQAQTQMQRHTAEAPAPSSPIAIEPPVQPTQQPVAAPAEEVHAELALPRLAGLGALNRDDARPVAKLPDVSLADPAAPLSSAPTPAQAAVAAPATQLVRPHDFAALIERIAVAREAAAPQAVSITISHQDFGPIRLSFRPEDTGLNVAMSSADPGFARAAAAIPAPVLPVTSAEQTQLNQQQRGDSSAAQTSGQQQSRGGSSDPRRDGQPQPQSNSAPRGARSGSAPRAGIFA